MLNGPIMAHSAGSYSAIVFSSNSFCSTREEPNQYSSTPVSAKLLKSSGLYPPAFSQLSVERQCLWVHCRAMFLQSIIKALQEHQLALTVSNQYSPFLHLSHGGSWTGQSVSHIWVTVAKELDLMVAIATVAICDHGETFQKKSTHWRYQSREQEPEPMDHLCHPATMLAHLVYVRTDTTWKTTCLHYLSLWSFQNTASQSFIFTWE